MTGLWIVAIVMAWFSGAFVHGGYVFEMDVTLAAGLGLGAGAVLFAVFAVVL